MEEIHSLDQFLYLFAQTGVGCCLAPLTVERQNGTYESHPLLSVHSHLVRQLRGLPEPATEPAELGVSRSLRWACSCRASPGEHTSRTPPVTRMAMRSGFSIRGRRQSLGQVAVRIMLRAKLG
jgi:hypothetical protein